MMARRLASLAVIVAGAALGSYGCSPGGPDAPGAAASAFCKHEVPERFCTICRPDVRKDPEVQLCAEHGGIPEAICTACHPELKAKYRTCPHDLPPAFCPDCAGGGGGERAEWCPHELPGALCIACHPELAATLPVCKEHGLAEAICTVCSPEIRKNFAVCEPHSLPRGACPDAACRAAWDAVRAGRPDKAPLPTVRLRSGDIEEKAGIESVPVVEAELARKVIANGEAEFDGNRMASVRVVAGGIIREVLEDAGGRVDAGATLAVIDSAELGAAKADHLAAGDLVESWKRVVERNRGLAAEDLVNSSAVVQAEMELRRAEAALLVATQKLRSFGLRDADLPAIRAEKEGERSLLRVLAPVAGTVTRRSAVSGELVAGGSELFVLADLSRMWVLLDLMEEDLRRVEVGNAVAFKVPGLAPAVFRGKVLWIDAEVDRTTRRVRARAEVENTSGLLRAHMFGSAEIHTGPVKTSLIVPADAIQWEGSSYVVFVKKGPGVFEPRRVVAAERRGAIVRLAWGDLSPGDGVATSGSFLLRTEIQKGAIGAGCCGD